MDEFKHYLQIDILKGLAIISVIILHTIPSNMVKTPFSILTIYQAVPIFFVLMGTNAFMSFKRRNYKSIAPIYPEYLRNRFKRILYPLLLVWILSLITCIIFNKDLYIGIFTIIGYLPLTGPGNYFISILLQFVLIFPVLYKLYRYNPRYLLLTSFIFNFVFEILSIQTPFLSNNSYVYKSCILRYLFLLVLGMWMVDNFEPESVKSVIKNKMVLIGSVMSFIYILLVSAFSWYFPYFQTPWQPQTILSFFYPLILCVFGLKYLPSAGNSFWNIISLIGKASYHIFLLQIIFFGAGFSVTSLIANSGMNSVYNTYMLGIIALAGNISITLILGLSFYYIEPKLTKKFNIESFKLNKLLYKIIPKILYK